MALLFARRIGLLISLVTLTSCSHATSGKAPGEFRVPSSVSTMGMNVTLREIFSAGDPRKESRAFVNRLLRIELRAHGWMLDTDRLFKNAKKPVDLFSEGVYRKLLVARPLIESTQDKIVSFYREAHQLSMLTPASTSEREEADKAFLVLAGIRDALQEARRNPAERLLLNDLMKEISEVHRTIGRGPLPVFPPLDGDKLAAHAANVAPELEKMLAELPESDEVKDEVEVEEAILSRAISSEGREPNAMNVYPTTGSNGNIDGFTFPKGTFALTFDDGPHEQHTMSQIANLQATGLKATFFWLAKNIVRYPEIVKKVMSAGMPLANHSYSHATLTSPQDLLRLHTNLDKEINLSTAVDTKYFGAKPKFFRCPYGAGFKDFKIRDMIAKLGMVHVRWNVDSLDWKDHNPATVLARVEQQMRVNGRGVILFHDIQPTTVIAARQLMEKYKGRARWVTIPQIVSELNGGAQ